MFAIVANDGAQVLVREGARVDVARLDSEIGSQITLDKVVMVGGDKPQYGKPLVEGASITAKVLEHRRGKKIRVMKFKRRKDYRRTIGSRQDFTRLEIVSIKAKG